MSWKKGLLLAVAAILLWCFCFSSHGLEVTNYVISSPKLAASVRVVQLGDLHNSEFGRNNARLTKLVQNQKPDIILLTGDMINDSDPKTDVAAGLIEQLAQIAPVYASLGNHERAHEQLFAADIQAMYEWAGATVLEREYADIEVGGQPMRIGGVLGYCLAERYLRTGEAKPEEIAYLKEFQNTQRLKILLCHLPLCWIVNDNLEQWDIDCVFASHTHGGQVRVPVIGGLYAPDQGWFPGRMQGLYRSQDRRRLMVLSRGLGSSGMPRINNVPEIVVVDILPQMK